MRTLIADAFPPANVAAIEAAHGPCDLRPDLSSEQLPDALSGVDVLVVRSTRVDAAALEAADRLRLVVRAGSGTNTIDTAKAASLGIAVCNAPGQNAAAVAELALGLLLCLDRRIPDAVADLRAGRWDKARYARARGLHGRDVGVIGLGQVGIAFAERAHAFGMRVHAVSRPDRAPAIQERAEAIDVRPVANLEELAAASDVLSLHVPSTPDTRGMVDHAFLSHCRDGTWIINTARGDLIDETALLHALDHRDFRAGIDVFVGEPAERTGEFQSALARHPNVYGTHHIGASTAQAQQAVADEVVRVVDAFAEGRLLHCVNGVTRPGEEAETPADH